MYSLPYIDRLYARVPASLANQELADLLRDMANHGATAQMTAILHEAARRIHWMHLVIGDGTP